MNSKKTLLLILVILWLVSMVSLVLILTNDSKEVQKLDEKKYIAMYMGDFDGTVSEDWFFFYNQVIDFHDQEKVPIALSFYPSTIGESEEFNEIIKKMYESDYVELVQKGYRGDEVEMDMETLSYDEQRTIIKEGQDYFREKMKEILEVENVDAPVIYNQIGGKFNEDTRKATESLGFIFYFDMFVGDNVEPLESTTTFDIVQYGVSFTTDGQPGKETSFFKEKELIAEINTYAREDLTVLDVDGIDVVTLWSHQQDFESKLKENEVDEKKWKIYTETILTLKEDPNITFVGPSEVYELRRD